MLQAYRWSVSEATGFTPYRLAFGREMRLPDDLGTPLPEPPRDVRTLAAELAEELVYLYRVSREVIGHGHRRTENRYNEHVVERAYQPGTLVRVLLHSRSRNVPSKLDAQYSGLCEVVEIRGTLLTLRELDMRRILTANYDSVRRSTIARPAVPPAPAARAAPLPLILRAVPQAYHVIQQQPAPHAPVLQAIPPVAPPQPAPQIAPPNRVPVAQRPHVPAISDLRDLSPLPPFGSPAVLPQRPLLKPRAKRKTFHNTRVAGPQPTVPATQSTQVPRLPSLLNLRINASPSPIPQAAPLPHLESHPSPTLAQQSPCLQPHLASLRKKPRSAVRIFNAVEDSQPPQAAFAPADKTNSQVAVASDSRVTGTPAAARVAYCYAVSLRSADVHNHNDHRYLLRATDWCAELRMAHAPTLYSAECTMARAQQVKDSPAERTLAPCKLQANRSSAARTCTLELRASKQRITGTA